MKEFIDKLSLGIVDYEVPSASVDVEQIILSVKPEETKEGGFNIYNNGKGKLKGVIYSSNRHLQIKTQTFCGEKNHISFLIDGSYLKEGTILKGKITVVSNGGEIVIPFLIKVEEYSISSSIGNIKNMFHFTNLVQKNYNEALKIFQSVRFSEVVLKKETQLKSKYMGLIGGVDKNIALEEFLIAANKKKPITLTVKETEKKYENLEEDKEDILNIEKDTWGYVTAVIETEGDFIQVEKKEVHNEDFNGSLLKLSFRIVKAKIHAGYNYGQIKVKTLGDEICIPVQAHKSMADIPVKDSEYLKKKQTIASLYQEYLAFRMNKTDKKVWIKNSQEMLKELLKSEKNTFLRLYQAQLLNAEKKDVECKKCLDEIGKELDGSFEKKEEIYAYYLYIRALSERDEVVTNSTLDRIRIYRENGNTSWSLLLIIMYLDENYDKNDSLKLIRIKERFDDNLTSPLLFFEALNVYNRTPSLLRVLDNFELNVIRFGIKYQCISKELEKRILELCNKTKLYKKEIFKLLTKLYRIQEQKDILESIVSLLIKGSKTNNKYFCWYEKAVEQDLKLTGLYEYYMYSISLDYEKKLPDVILMYFVYNITLKGERLEFLYENVMKYRQTSESIYKFYSKIIDKYVADCIIEGRINEKLAALYNVVLENATFAPEFSDKLPDILNTYMIQCENENMKEVIVTYREINREERIPLIQGKAYIRLFSEDTSVVLEDLSGNRYISTVPYKITKLLNLDDLLKICYEIKADNLGLLLYFNDKYFKVRKYQEKAIEVMKKLAVTPEIRKDYKSFLEKEIIDYYSKNSTDVNFEKFLSNLKVEKYEINLIVEIMETAITRGLYQQGYSMMVRFGCEYLNDALVFRCVNHLIQERTEEDKNLLALAFYAFRKGKYDEHTLQYIGQYFYGGMEDLYSIWTAIKNFQCENTDLEEKIIVQMLFTGEYGNHIGSVFDSYAANGGTRKVKQAYLIRKSYDYFVKEAIVDKRIFRHIETALLQEEDVNYVCILAYLKYLSEKGNLSDIEKSLGKDLVEQMYKRKKYYEFYKKFSKYFELPEGFAEKSILEYRTIPGKTVRIHYLLEGVGGETDYTTETMINSCHGIYIYPVILFYGEKIKYYITEEADGKSVATESRAVSISSDHTWEDNSIFGMLNNMMMCREMNEESTLNELVTEFCEKKKLNQNIFMTV